MPQNERDWVATETVWGDAAYEEIKNAFPGKLKSREVALCVWCYGRHPDITETEIEAIAKRDPVIMEMRRQKKISAHGKRRAKTLLGLGAKKDENYVDPSLSDFEREILLDLRATAALLDDYRKAEARMRKAEAAFEVARAKLHAITPQSARNLAEFEPKTRALLDAEGLREDHRSPDPVESVTAAPAPVSQPVEPTPSSQPPRHGSVADSKPTVTADPVPPGPTTQQPEPQMSDAGETIDSDSKETNPVDFALNVLKKKVSLAPSSSMIEDVPALFDDEEILDEDYHAKMDDCTQDAIVFWPDGRESLFD